MIIKLSKDFINNLHLDQYSLTCLDMLMLAYREGRHQIVILPIDVKNIFNIDKLSSTTKTSLLHYYRHFSNQSLELLKLFPCAIEVISSNSSEKCYFEPKTETFFSQVKSSELADSSKIQNTILLGENLSDVELYKLMGNYYINKEKIKYMRIITDDLSGGGNTTDKSYESIFIKRDKFCVCLLDSDKKSSESRIGHTAIKVFKFHNSQKSKNHKCLFYIPTEFHELENLLPIEFYSDYYLKNEGDDSNRYAIKTINSSSIMYFDYKEGLLCKICNETKPHSKFWSRELLIECFDQCPHKGQNNCNHKIIDGFGKHILDDFLDYIKGKDLDVIIGKFPSIIKHWEDIGQFVANWCCGGTPVRII